MSTTKIEMIQNGCSAKTSTLSVNTYFQLCRKIGFQPRLSDGALCVGLVPTGYITVLVGDSVPSRKPTWGTCRRGTGESKVSLARKFRKLAWPFLNWNASEIVPGLGRGNPWWCG